MEARRRNMVRRVRRWRREGVRVWKRGWDGETMVVGGVVLVGIVKVVSVFGVSVVGVVSSANSFALVSQLNCRPSVAGGSAWVRVERERERKNEEYGQEIYNRMGKREDAS